VILLKSRGDFMAEFKDRLKEALKIRKISAAELARLSHVNEGAISQYKKGAYKATQENLDRLAKTLNVSIAWLMGADVPMEKEIKLASPIITDEVITFPVIGEIAAGYNHIANEDWSGDTVEVPKSFLKGRPKSDYIVLKVHGDSMYPLYQDGDVVLVLKQSTLDYSGDIGAIIYGEDWLRLVPLNPLFKPETIEGENLEHCRVIGIPKLLIREID
jgi:repressor LexA